MPSGRHCQKSRSSARLAAQHVGGALDRPRDDLRPAFLEPAPRHHAVLHGEDQSSAQSIAMRRAERALSGPSSVVGTTNPPTKPMA